MPYTMVAKLAISLLGPFAKGALGMLLNLALVAGIVTVGSYVFLDVNLVVVAMDAVGALVDMALDWAADQLTSRIGL